MVTCCAANVQIGGSSSGVNSVYYQGGICTIPVSLLTMLYSCSEQSMLFTQMQSLLKNCTFAECFVLCYVEPCPALPCPALPCPALPTDVLCA